jgi:hypothetical protein
MAYTQNPGRGNHSKTGHGLPMAFQMSPMHQKQKQKNKIVTIDPNNFMGDNKKTSEFNRYKYINVSKELGNKIDEVTQRNKFRNIVENQAKNDSIVAHKSTKGTEFEKGKAGNTAANITRDLGGSPETKVSQGRNSEGYVTYARNKAVELNMPEAVMNKKTGEYTYDKNKSLKKQLGSWETKNYQVPGWMGFGFNR